MRHFIGSIVGMLAGLGLVATQIYLWWWFAFKESVGLEPRPIAHVVFVIPGILLFFYSFKRYTLARRQQGNGEPVEPPAPSPTMKGLGRFFWNSGHVVLALSIGGTVAMVVSAHFNPTTGASGVPLGMGLMLAGILYALGAGLKNG